MQTKDVRALKKELRDDRALLRCAEEFGMVGDPTRLKICYLLCRHKELSVGDIAEAVGVSISAVSRTLGKLERARFVRGRRDFRHVYYRLSPSPLTAIIKRRLLHA